MDLSKFTDEYLASTPKGQLHADYKELVRHQKACNKLSAQLRSIVVEANEQADSDARVLAMSPAARKRLANSLAMVKVKIKGTVG